MALPQIRWLDMQCYGKCSSCCAGSAVPCARFIVECSENRRRASSMKINNYTRVALRILAAAPAGDQLGIHRRRRCSQLTPARSAPVAVVRVRPPGNRAPPGQIDSGSSGDDAMPDTGNTTVSRCLVHCTQLFISMKCFMPTNPQAYR